MSSFIQKDNHPFDSGYSSSSTKKEKPSGGLLGSLKELFSKKGHSRKGIIPSNSNNDADIADNYQNFKRSDNRNPPTSDVSPYEFSPDFFFSNQGVKRTSDLFKPRQFQASPQEPVKEEEFEIPVASGPARKSIVGLFSDPPPTATVTAGPPPTDNAAATDFLQTVSPHVFDTPKAAQSQRSSVSSQSTIKPQENALSHKSSASSMQSIGFSNFPTIKVSSEEEQQNSMTDDVPVVIKTLSPQDSDLSIRSEEPSVAKSIQQSRAHIRRGSLSNSIVSDISAISTERSEGRRNRRRSGPKLIGPQVKKQDELSVSGAPAVSHILPSIPPPAVHMDPRYMPYHPYMLPPDMTAVQYAPIQGQQQNGKQLMPQHRRQPHPQYIQSQPPPAMAMYHHPEVYGGGYTGGGTPAPLMSGPPLQPVMFPPVMEEVVEGSTGQLRPPQPRRNKRSKPVQRSRTMDPTMERPKVESRRKNVESDQDNQEGVKGFDDFALY